jgi:hypothetical protein
VTFVAVVGLVGSGVPAIPHTHAGMSKSEQRQHDAVPHFHWGRLGDSGHHQHAHPHPHGEHRRPTTAPLKDLPDGSHPDRHSHNADAVFVSVAVGLRPVEVSGALMTNLQPAPQTICWVTSVDFVDGVNYLVPWSRPPNNACDESDLFLKLRTLRI